MTRTIVAGEVAPLADAGHRGGELGPTTAFAYQPALDGVRAVAVTAVLLCHAGFGWMTGGYVGVSVFFTLSGYLITALAIAEHDATGRFALSRFYARRVRRLLPASLLCVAAVVALALAGQFDDVPDLRRDVWAALAQVYNWVTLASGDSYADQVAAYSGARSPLDHYWSLAVEEQFYWLWPLALLPILTLAPTRRRRVLAVVVASVAVVTVVVAAGWGEQAAYLATPARLVEILAGAWLAAHLAGGRRAWPAPLGAVALALLAVFAWRWPTTGGPAYRGGFVAVAAVSVTLIAALQRPSPVRRALSWRPLVALGRISYGVYLFHWPVYVLVDERRLDVGRAQLFAIRVAITLAVAVVSFHLLESPARRRRAGWRPTVAVALFATAAVAAPAVAITPSQADFPDVGAEERRAASIPLLAAGEQLAPLGERPLRVVIAGDSVAYSVGDGLVRWALDHPERLQVSSMAGVGCGLDVSGIPIDDVFTAGCARVGAALPALVAATQPDVVVALVTFRDIEPRAWSAAEGVLEADDERYQQHLADGYVALSRRLLAEGADTVVWVVSPTPQTYMTSPIDIHHDVVRRVPAAFPDGGVAVLDLDAWMAAQSDPPDRYDGLHYSAAGGYELADRYLVDELATIARREAG